MNEYASLAELQVAWTTGEFEYPSDITIAGIHYTFARGSSFDFASIVRDGKNPYVIYHTAATHKEEAKSRGLNQWVVLLWGTPDGRKVVPYDIRTIVASRGKAVYEQVETIGDVALLKIALPSGVVAIKGKVDTGAEISSLHTDGKPKVVGDMVQFVNRHASPNAIQAPMVDRQAVSSADGGTEYRPVIELDVEINGKMVRKAMFNLNDRSEMEYPVLIGQNVLEKTGFLVDPRKNNVQESDEWLTEEELSDINDDDIVFENVEQKINIDAIPEGKMAALYQAMDDADITIKDLFRHIRTKAIQQVEDIGG